MTSKQLTERPRTKQRVIADALKLSNRDVVSLMNANGRRKDWDDSKISRFMTRSSDDLTAQEKREFCTAVGFSATMFFSATIEQLTLMLAGSTFYFPGLADRLARSEGVAAAARSMSKYYCAFNASLANPDHAYVSHIEILGIQRCDAASAGISFVQTFPEHQNQVITGKGHVLPVGSSLCFIGEYDNIDCFPYFMMFQAPPRKWLSRLSGIGLALSTDTNPIVVACRMIAIGYDNADAAPYPIGILNMKGTTERPILRELHSDGVTRIQRPDLPA